MPGGSHNQALHLWCRAFRALSLLPEREVPEAFLPFGKSYGFLWISGTLVRPHLPCFWRRFVIPLQRADAEALLGREQRSGLAAYCEGCQIRNPARLRDSIF